jgi:hypothetical protein
VHSAKSVSLTTPASFIKRPSYVYKKYDPAQVEIAIHNVLNGHWTVGHAIKATGVPRSSLYKAIKDHKKKNASQVEGDSQLN